MPFTAFLIEQPLAIFAAQTGATEAFRLFGLDPAHGGALAEACALAGHDPLLVLASLEVLAAAPAPEPELDWATAPLASLTDHIVREHHRYLRRVLPALWALVERLQARDPAMAVLASCFEAFWQAVSVHLDAEELLVFAPAERLAVTPSPADAHALVAALPRMASEHGTADGHLAALVALTEGLPRPGGPGLEVLRKAVGWLAADMASHVAHEDRWLYARARVLASYALS